MYPRHKFLLFFLSGVIGTLACFFDFRIDAMASDAISVVSISSALYLAAYAGIQASSDLKIKLKNTDPVLTHRTQLFVINTYIKKALLLNVITIVLICLNTLVLDKLSRMDISIVARLIDWICGCAGGNIANDSLRNIWQIVSHITNWLSLMLFTANIVQMCLIGLFVVNRIPFDK